MTGRGKHETTQEEQVPISQHKHFLKYKIMPINTRSQSKFTKYMKINLS